MPKIAKALREKSQVNSLETTTHELDKPRSLKVLITRPEAKAKHLALLLKAQGIESTSQPLFDYQPSASSNEISLGLNQADIVIFVSEAAVRFTHATYALTAYTSPHSQPTDNRLLKTPALFFAVGGATKEALCNLGITDVLSPSSQEEHSEGLLKLPELNNVAGKDVLIIRGNGGREHIANTLISRGAKVNYIESYQRVWRTLTKNIAQQWHATQINCIVVTSNDILVALLDYLSNTSDIKDDYWRKQCLWIVVSERIEKNAKALGLSQVVNAQSASPQILCDTLQALSCA